jgi:hypothetical protein
MEDNIWVRILLTGIGFFAILGSLFNWDFFFESKKATTFVKFFGRNGARVFYSILGIIIISMSAFFIK